MSAQDEVDQRIRKDSAVDCALRDLFVGTVMEEGRLETTAFSRVAESGPFTRWERYWDRKKGKVSLVLAPDGTLCQLDHLQWIDHAPDEYIGAARACGWHFRMHCTKHTEDAIRDELQACVSERRDRSASTDFSSALHMLGIERSEIDPNMDDAYVLCAHASEARNHAPPLARLICTILTRHHREIGNPSVLYDLPHLCGRLGLLPECVVTARYLLRMRAELPATCWSNLGAALTDNARQHGAGFLCFMEAIRADPALPQPRQGIWHAGRRLMHEYFVRNDFEGASRVADDSVRVGSIQNAPHGFFTYQGLAYEMTARFGDALEAYKRAILLDEGCHIARSGLERQKARADDSGRHRSFLGTAKYSISRLVESGAFSDLAPEDRYPWTCKGRR